MNAGAITAKILEEARGVATVTLREASEKASRIRQQSDAELEQKRAAMAAQAEGEVSQLRDRMLRMAELDQKKTMLAVKRQVIDEAFDDALTKLRVMPAERQRTYIKQLLLQASEDGEQLIVDAKDAALFDEAFIAQLNAALKAASKPPVALSGETRDLGGGFVLKRGGMEINCTYQSVLSQLRPALEVEVAGKLFGAE